MDTSKQDDTLQIAKQVEELVSNPANLQHWRQKVASTFNRPEVVKIKDFESIEYYKSDPATMKRWRQEKGNTLPKKIIGSPNLWQASRDEVDVLLQKWLDDLDPKTDIDVLYTLLAFYHDSRLPIRHIVDDDIKKQSPVFCEWMSLYYARGILIRPNMAIFPSQSEQCTVEQCLDVYLSHVERDLAAQQDLQRQQPKEAEQPAETENEPPLGFMSAHDIAKYYKVECEPLRKRLERLRKKNDSDRDLYRAVENREASSPAYLYNVGDERVKKIIKKLRDKNRAARPSNVQQNKK